MQATPLPLLHPQLRNRITSILPPGPLDWGSQLRAAAHALAGWTRPPRLWRARARGQAVRSLGLLDSNGYPLCIRSLSTRSSTWDLHAALRAAWEEQSREWLRA